VGLTVFRLRFLTKKREREKPVPFVFLVGMRRFEIPTLP